MKWPSFFQRYTPSDWVRSFSRFQKLAEEMKLKQREQATPTPAPIEAARATVHWTDHRDTPRPKKRGRAKGVRDWSKVTGITLHQTATNFAGNPDRLLNVPVHGGVLRGNDECDAQIVQLHDPTYIMWHAGKFNSRDIGIEIDCRASGVLDNLTTAPDEGMLSFWRPKGSDRLPEEATDHQLEAVKQLITYYVALVADNGGKLEYIHAHRQSSKNRTSDPGERIWKAIGIWAQETHGLKVGPPDFKVGDGTPLPDLWTGKPNGQRYNWRIDGRMDKDQ
jgi:N-acetyl-anhydromuramyl-L-alanine amidase AmpD